MSLLTKGRTAGLLGSSALVVGAMIGMAGPAHAADYSLGGGPAVDFQGSSITFVDVEAEVTAECASVEASGTLSPGDYDFGDVVGTLASANVDFTDCYSAELGSAVVINANGTWNVSVTGGPNAAGAYQGKVSNVSVTVVIGACSFTVTGDITGTLDPATQTLTATGGTLTVTSANAACASFGIYVGDTITMIGSLINVATPPITIT